MGGGDEVYAYAAIVAFAPPTPLSLATQEMYGSIADDKAEEIEPETPQKKRASSRAASNTFKQVTRCLRRYKHLRQRLQNTTIHGLAHIVQANSCAARLFWTFIFLAALGGCSYFILDRVIFYAKRPAATTVSLDSSQQNISFPAVTICNLNSVKLSYATENNLALLLSYISNPFVYNSTLCRQLIEDTPVNKSLRQVYYEGRSTLDEFVKYCAFYGNNLSLLNCAQSFSTSLTDLGYCYTFNGEINAPEVSVSGVGAFNGLHVVLEINQSEYLPNFGDAGVKVAIHPRGVLPQPFSKGISVPAGRSSFIGLQKQVVRDMSTNSHCVQEKELTFFKFVSSSYSTSACQLIKDYSDVALGCNCLDALTDVTYDDNNFIRNCTVADACCVTDQHVFAVDTPCPVPCSYTSFKASTTYSTFPSISSAALLGELFNITVLDVTENLVSVRVFFEDLNTQIITTEDSYSAVALFSDIGGQLGLLLGASLISVIELCMYCFEAFVGRCKERSRVQMKRVSLEKEGGCSSSEKVQENGWHLVDAGDLMESTSLTNSTKS